jgi:hypothetical protein
MIKFFSVLSIKTHSPAETFKLNNITALQINQDGVSINIPVQKRGFLSMGYKKDIFAVFAYDFELLPFLS